MEIPGYIIQKEIGKGGMATVYLATQESLGRHVVLKILDQLQTDKAEDMAERFITEGRILASLNHPNIITIYDIGISNHLLDISMEYVHGGDLRERLELPISADEVLDLLAKISSALGEAHKHGIVHRDVKPANILFRDENTPLLTDFGIAKQVNLDSDLTSTGIFLGSPNYVSPEQAEGFPLDGRADIYSLGCIFYEMLTGEKPFRSSSVIDVVIQHKQAPIPTLPEECAEFQPMLNRMMAKKRDERIADADELIIEIQRLQRKRRRRAVEVGLVAPEEMTPKQRFEHRQRRSKQILAGLLLLGLILFSSLKYVEIRLKSPIVVRTDRVTTTTVLDKGPIHLAVQAAAAASKENRNTAAPSSSSAPSPSTQQVIKALTWLGKQSLDKYKLTYPPNDNAYYYYTRLLELDPNNQTAIRGILSIADHYATLAEQAMARNEWQRTAAYVDIGLRIDPHNRSLLALRELVKKQNASLLATIKSLFTGK
ncbi:MAG: serine/threonine-protein kinase [Gammaproteobacteria bacterium]